MTKSIVRTFGLSSAILLSAVSLACASPALHVKIKNSSGKTVYTGETDSQGMFTTESLAPGSYVIQFNAATSVKGGPLALMVHAGQQESSAGSVPASKFNKGGVAMKIKISSPTALTGQVAPAGSKMAEAAAAPVSTSTSKATASTRKKSRLKTKVVDGKTMVWIHGDDAEGSSFGHWAPEGSTEAQRAEANAR